MAAKEAMLGQLDALKAKYDDAVEARKKTEHDIEMLRPVSHSGKKKRLLIFSTYAEMSFLFHLPI